MHFMAKTEKRERTRKMWPRPSKEHGSAHFAREWMFASFIVIFAYHIVSIFILKKSFSSSLSLKCGTDPQKNMATLILRGNECLSVSSSFLPIILSLSLSSKIFIFIIIFRMWHRPSKEHGNAHFAREWMFRIFIIISIIIFIIIFIITFFKRTWQCSLFSTLRISMFFTDIH